MVRKQKKSVKSSGKNMNWSCGNGCSHGSSIYGLGFLGALVYYIQTATGFWAGVLGVLKAIVWPAFLAHKLFGM